MTLPSRARPPDLSPIAEREMRVRASRKSREPYRNLQRGVNRLNRVRYFNLLFFFSLNVMYGSLIGGERRWSRRKYNNTGESTGRPSRGWANNNSRILRSPDAGLYKKRHSKGAPKGHCRGPVWRAKRGQRRRPSCSRRRRPIVIHRGSPNTGLAKLSIAILGVRAPLVRS